MINEDKKEPELRHYCPALNQHLPSLRNVRINPVKVPHHAMAVNSTANLPRRFFSMHNQGARRSGAWVGLLVFENLKTMMKAHGYRGEGCNR